MKKKTLNLIICLALAIVCAFALTACGEKKAEPAPAEAAEETSEAPAEAAEETTEAPAEETTEAATEAPAEETTEAPTEAATEAATEAPAEEKEAAAGFTVADGILSVATNAAFPPYEFTEGDEFKGIDMDLAKVIAEKLGLTLEINDVEFGSIIGGIQSGKYDLGMAGMTKTEERLKSVNFSDTYAVGIQVIIVKEDSEIAGPDDLAEKMIGVQQDTTGDIYCCDDFGDDHVTEFKTGADAVQALLTGKVDCVVIDNEPAKSFVAANKGLKILDTEYVEEEYAIAVSKEHEELLAKINEILKGFQEDGTLDGIVSTYITAE